MAHIGSETLPTIAQAILGDSAGVGIRHGITRLPVDTIFLLDLTLRETEGEARFVRVVVSSVRSILEFMAGQDVADIKITALQARSVEHPEVVVETVTELDALPPQLVSYTLESGERFAIVGHNEPKRMWPLVRSGAEQDCGAATNDNLSEEDIGKG